jgi:hypothetical protein
MDLFSYTVEFLNTGMCPYSHHHDNYAATFAADLV